MADQLHLSPRHRGVLEALLREHLPDVEAWAYGSRVNGRSHDGSDLDLALRAPGLTKIPAEQLVDFKDAVCESTIPFLVEARDWARLPERFHREIEREHLVLRSLGPQTGEAWSIAPLGRIVTFLSGGTPSKRNPSYWAGSIPWVSAKDMKSFRLSDTQDHVTSEGAANGTRMVPKGTVLLLTRGMTLLNSIPVCLIKQDMAFNQDIKALLPAPGVLPRYLPYLILGNSRRLRRLVDLAGHGTGRLNSEELKALDVRLPPTSEQRAIADILGALDDKIELNRRMNETLEAMARALFKSWFVDFEPVRAKAAGRDCNLPEDVSSLFADQIVTSEHGNVPAGWRTYTLAELVEHHTESIAPGATPDAEFEHFSIPAYDTGQTPSLQMGADIKSNKTLVPHESVLLSKLNPDIPRVWIPGQHKGQTQISSTEFLAFTPSGCANRSLLYSLFSDQAFRTMLRSMVTGTSKSHQRVPPQALKRGHVISGTAALFRAFSEIASPWLARTIASREECQLVANTRDALLPKLISGEIRLTDAERIVGSMT